MIAIDAALPEWYNPETGCYDLPKAKKTMTRQQLVNMWKKFTDNYPILSLEDGMGENDWEGWALLTKTLGQRLQLVGATTCSSPTQRLKTGIEKEGGQRHPHQSQPDRHPHRDPGRHQMANRAGYTAVVSHRSGRPRTPPSPTSGRGLNKPVRSRPAPPAAPTAWPSTTSCSASRRSWTTWLSTTWQGAFFNLNLGKNKLKLQNGLPHTGAGNRSFSTAFASPCPGLPAKKQQRLTGRIVKLLWAHGQHPPGHQDLAAGA